ncbi:hypothetical protein K438DRAFT_1012893 [Mycena galopus ATCC 62051]|nr:hypothetical protein K438DRAFT_1012893 [Mycena galopus ATCC 62051]
MNEKEVQRIAARAVRLAREGKSWIGSNPYVHQKRTWREGCLAGERGGKHATASHAWGRVWRVAASRVRKQGGDACAYAVMLAASASWWRGGKGCVKRGGKRGCAAVTTREREHVEVVRVVSSWRARSRASEQSATGNAAGPNASKRSVDIASGWVPGWDTERRTLIALDAAPSWREARDNSWRKTRDIRYIVQLMGQNAPRRSGLPSL